jgi:SAM-dependent methyltransferase
MLTEHAVENNRQAWNIACGTYAAHIENHVERLRAGELSFCKPELPHIQRLLPQIKRAIHLQCSHGMEALSFWKAGVPEVIGIDISEGMLTQARKKAALLDAPVRFIQSDVHSLPDELSGTADLVYTGCGALCWVMDLQRWAAQVFKVLKPGGRVFVFEGHPLNAVWEPTADKYILREDRGDYFAQELRQDREFPASAIEDHTPEGTAPVWALERQWTLGQIVTTLAQTGLILECLEEHPAHFWGQFKKLPDDLLHRLPHTFLLIMRK